MSSDYTAILTGKHALVTGGARGIGEGIARALARHGARVSVVSRQPAAVDADFTTAQADVRDEEQVRRAFAICRKANGPVEILVNNSGIADSAPLIRTSLALFERVVGTNLTGTFLCSREASQDMLIAKWGRILNIASIAGLHGAPYISAYCASKHGVVGFTRAIAAEFGGTGVTANAICPGYTETDMMRLAIEKIVTHTGASEDSARSTLAQMNPEGRIATVGDVAQAALELICGEKNGVSLIVPGGEEA
ncbi:MAG TPA: SDR family oxidoreductase [Candidatus Baltobacteraceae bacterium]|nr:SDR family oxidoreductase [Candidatus Baltobacteraceae bacterium]